MLASVTHVQPKTLAVLVLNNTPSLHQFAKLATTHAKPATLKANAQLVCPHSPAPPQMENVINVRFQIVWVVQKKHPLSAHSVPKDFKSMPKPKNVLLKVFPLVQSLMLKMNVLNVLLLIL